MKLRSPMLRLLQGLPVLLIAMVASFAAHADELCPDTTKGEKGMTVNQMADLQFDIGRLNLCLQRARLLQQIDETVKKREEIRAQPLSVNTTGGYGGIPPLATALPPLPGDKGSSATVPMPPAASAILPPLATVSTEWQIQRIWGQGNVMQAQLVKNDVIANVKKGDTLPSGEKIIELSGRGVTLDNGKTQHGLSWLADGKSDKSGTNAGQNQ